MLINVTHSESQTAVTLFAAQNHLDNITRRLKMLFPYREWNFSHEWRLPTQHPPSGSAISATLAPVFFGCAILATLRRAWDVSRAAMPSVHKGGPVSERRRARRLQRHAIDTKTLRLSMHGLSRTFHDKLPCSEQQGQGTPETTTAGSRRRRASLNRDLRLWNGSGQAKRETRKWIGSATKAYWQGSKQ